LIGSGSVGQDDGPADAPPSITRRLALMDRTLLVADTENFTSCARSISTHGRSRPSLGLAWLRPGRWKDGPWRRSIPPWISRSKEHLLHRDGGIAPDLALRSAGLLRPRASRTEKRIVDGRPGGCRARAASGLSLEGNYPYFADSEESVVRRIDLAAERVETMVGRGLFDFGDVDGPMRASSTPAGVSAWKGSVFVADT
jgi:hypothetical protein